MKRIVVAALVLTCCVSTTNQIALETERGLTAGSAALDVAVDAAIAVCRARDLPTPEARADCMEEIVQIDAAAGEVVVISVDALRAYWEAIAKDDRGGAAAALARLIAAADSLPPKYFAGVQRMIRQLR